MPARAKGNQLDAESRPRELHGQETAKLLISGATPDESTSVGKSVPEVPLVQRPDVQMRLTLCVFSLALLMALDACGDASARGHASADQRPAVPATIGALDCSTLSVPIHLDNGAGLATRVFVVERREAVGASRSYQVVMLATGEHRALDLAVRDHRHAMIFISDEADDDGRTLARADIDVSCSPEPTFDAKASLQPVDCSDHTLPVVLDNTRSENSRRLLLGDLRRRSWKDPVPQDIPNLARQTDCCARAGGERPDRVQCPTCRSARWRR